MNKIIFIFLITIVFFPACKFSKERINDEADKKEAEKSIDNFYSLLKQKKNDSVKLLFDPSIITNDTAKFREFLIQLSDQIQILKERKLDHWDTKIVTGLDAGSFYSLYYINYYEGNHIFKVSIKLAKDQEDKIKITGFQLDPNKFL